MEHAKTTARVASGRPRCCACIAVRAGGPGWNDRHDHRNGHRRDDEGADRRRDVTASSPSQVAHVTTDASGRFTFLSLAPETYTISVEHARIRARLDPASRSLPIRASRCRSRCRRASSKLRASRSRSSLSPVRPGTGTDVYSVNPALDRGGRAARRRRRTEQRVLRDRRDAGRVRSAQSGRRQSNRLHSRRLLRPDRLRVRRRADQSVVRQLSRKLGDDARPARAADLHRRRRSRRECDRSRRLHQSSHQDRNLSRLRHRRPGESARRRSITTRAVEAGGSTPDRLFSYYVGISGTNQDFRYFDQFNGASLDRHDSLRLLAVVHHDVPALSGRRSIRRAE